jgi:hypothetical protein
MQFMRKILSFLLLSAILLPYGISQAGQKVIWDILNNQYKVTLDQGDTGTLYFMNDQSLVFIPENNNVIYSHLCWGSWKLTEETQMIRIRGGNFCSFLKGEYAIREVGQNFKLEEKSKRIILQTIKSR